MKHGVFYLLTGPAHGARLVVSLWSLRRHYSGPVTIYTTHPDSHEIGERCLRDDRLAIEHRKARLSDRPRNASFLTKLDLLPEVPFEVGIYLDADTLISGPIDPLWMTAQEQQFATTQFSDWVASGRTIRRRIEAWRSVRQTQFDPDWLTRLIDDALQPSPAVNGGVFAFRRNAEILSMWRELAYAGSETFICDEIALQLLLGRYPHQVLDCRFNCSPVYAKGRRDVRIWHFHGEKHVGSQHCRELWWPAYRICLAENIAGLAEWSPGADRRLARFVDKALTGALR
ncbi:MAG: hypothetical protein L0Z50_17930 [Verrucomicrobiales bacterium]|nr:hypothetical protein [Verrucomicrobiales bacterium]